MAGQSVGKEIIAVDEAFEVIARRALNVLASTPLERGDFIANGLWGHEFAARLADPGRRDEFFILDVRSRDAFDEGHIEGAEHIEFAEWASSANLARLPLNRKIAVICETGLEAAQVVSGLRMLGYDAVVPKTGINGWTRSSAAERLLEELQSVKHPVKRVPPVENFVKGTGEAVFDRPHEDDYAIIASRIHDVFSSAGTVEAGSPGNGSADEGRHLIGAGELLAKLLDENARQEIFLLDLRREEDFEGVGHIEGALRIDFDAAAVPENLEMLPRDKKIVSICYTGNLAAQLTVVLRMLGYDAAALSYGMVGWTRTPTTYLYLKDLQKADNPLV
ncbi:MAG: rhodanese-like domain-containing protein [Actinobacteria bacterium]|nr:rhodanese-like domain-containing protein [Actinomycetota bacterium]